MTQKIDFPLAPHSDLLLGDNDMYIPNDKNAPQVLLKLDDHSHDSFPSFVPGNPSRGKRNYKVVEGEEVEVVARNLIRFNSTLANNHLSQIRPSQCRGVRSRFPSLRGFSSVFWVYVLLTRATWYRPPSSEFVIFGIIAFG